MAFSKSSELMLEGFPDRHRHSPAVLVSAFKNQQALFLSAQAVHPGLSPMANKVFKKKHARTTQAQGARAERAALTQWPACWYPPWRLSPCTRKKARSHADIWLCSLPLVKLGSAINQPLCILGSGGRPRESGRAAADSD